LGGDYSGKAVDSKSPSSTRNGIKLDYDKWPGGQIPYVISNAYTQRERAVIARAMQAYHDKTCIRFVPRNKERDYLYIAKIDGCFSDVGRAGGRQELSLHDGCVEYDTAIHELMHAVGFWHEHERWDRNDHIDIIWNNIERDAYDQFGKVNLLESDYYGENYDYFSIMHYDSKSFSKNGLNTIEAKVPDMTRIVGRVKDFSPTDLRKINKMYRCPSNNNVQQVSTTIAPTIARSRTTAPRLPVANTPSSLVRGARHFGRR